jgi:anti-sigma factor RsiW
MMNDCQNTEIREVLPELVNGALSEIDSSRVVMHLDGCDDCSAELAIIRAVRGSAAAAPVNVAHIVAAIPPYRRKSSGMKRVYLELAAACLIGAVGISALAVHKSGSVIGGLSAMVSGDAVDGSVSAAGLALVSTSELSDAGLEQLTQDLENLQAMPTADPEPVTSAVLEQSVFEEVTGSDAAGDSA